MKLAWPERLIGFVALCAILWILFLMMTCQKCSGLAQLMYGPKMLLLPLIFLLPFWVVLRAIDWLGAGPARRKKHINARFSP